jgi:hypothetical protein
MAAAELPAGPAAQLPHDPAAQPPHDPAAQPPHDPAAQRLPAGPAAQPPHDPAAQRLPAGPAGEPVSVVRHGPGARPPVDSPGGTVRTLVRGERAMLPVEYTGAPSVFDEYICHDGEEFVYVVGGVIEVDIEGELHVAAAGDSVYYAGGLRHRWRSIGDTEVQLVVVQQNLRSRGRRELAPPKHGADAHVT